MSDIIVPLDNWNKLVSDCHKSKIDLAMAGARIEMLENLLSLASDSTPYNQILESKECLKGWLD